MGSISQTSVFDAAEFVEPDAIFEVLRRYTVDTFPQKVNLSAGAYRDEDGKPWFLPSVRMAEKKIAGSDHEYLPMMGMKAFRDACFELLLHDTKALAEGRVSHRALNHQHHQPQIHTDANTLQASGYTIPLRHGCPPSCWHDHQGV